MFDGQLVATNSLHDRIASMSTRQMKGVPMPAWLAGVELVAGITAATVIAYRRSAAALGRIATHLFPLG